jgi:hypothetical protein
VSCPLPPPSISPAGLDSALRIGRFSLMAHDFAPRNDARALFWSAITTGQPPRSGFIKQFNILAGADTRQGDIFPDFAPKNHLRRGGVSATIWDDSKRQKRAMAIRSRSEPIMMGFLGVNSRISIAEMPHRNRP